MATLRLLGLRRVQQLLPLPRAALALGVGATVTALAAFAMAARSTRPIADLLPDG